MDLEMEKQAIVEGIGEEKYLPILTGAARKLELSGAGFLVMPCNSLHAFIEEIRGSVKIPVLSIVEETTKFLQVRKIESVGLISTVITKRRRLYENAFKIAGIKTILPNELEQAKIGKIIRPRNRS